MNTIVDFFVLNVLPIIWILYVGSLITFNILWKMGKIKITYRNSSDG